MLPLAEKALVSKDPFWLVESGHLFIKTKSGDLKPLELNSAQKILHKILKDMWDKGEIIRILILKARQLGISTYIEALIFAITAYTENVNSAVIADSLDNSNYIFEMTKLYQEKMSAHLQNNTKKSNEKKIEFDGTHSQIVIDTAENKEAGRGRTYRCVHLSEYAFFRRANELMLGLNQSVPDLARTIIVKETTANGYNFFKDEWDAVEEGQSDEKAIFIAWFWSDEYLIDVKDDFEIGDVSLGLLTKDEPILEGRMKALKIDRINERLQWRRYCILNKCGKGGMEKQIDNFYQEYPSCLVYDTYVSTNRGIIKIGSVSKEDNETESGKIVAYGAQPKSDIYELITKYGRSIKGTFDHPIKLYGSDKFKGISQLDIGDLIELKSPMFTKHEYKKILNPIPSVEYIIKIDKDWARFIGYFMGDGSWHKNVISIICDKKDEDVISDVKNLCKRLFKETTSRVIKRKQGVKGCEEVRFGCIDAKYPFKYLGLIHNVKEASYKRKVHVPDCIFQSPKHIIKEFLSALFECDGSTSNNIVRFGSSKLGFIRQVQLLLLGFNIESRITEQIKKSGSGHNYTFYALNLPRENSDKFMKEIGFISKRKQSCLFPKRQLNPNNDKILCDEVISIKKVGFDTTYDLTIENEHVFSANGILTHNTPIEAFRASGQCFFDKEKLMSMYDLAEDGRTGNVVKDSDGYVFREFDNGPITIYSVPKVGSDYVVGGDASSGTAEDNGSIVVRDWDTNEIVATVYGKHKPDELEEMAFRLGMFYNEALIAFENDKFGFSINKGLIQRYGNIFFQEVLDRRTNKRVKKFGWDTTGVSRPLMLAYMQEDIDDDSLWIKNKALIKECLTFIDNPKTGKVEAMEGCHDDFVIACAISGAVRHLAKRRVKHTERRKRGIRYGAEKKKVGDNAGFGFS